MKLLYGLVLIFVIPLVFYFAPLLLIWALNTLFGFGLVMTLDVWLAALFLILLFGR